MSSIMETLVKEKVGDENDDWREAVVSAWKAWWASEERAGRDPGPLPPLERLLSGQSPESE